VRPRDVARILAAGRVAIGAGLLAAPRLSLGMWVGRDAAPGSVAPVGRALGAREVVLGSIALHPLDPPQVGPRWVRTLAACDVVDLVATLAARRTLPAPGYALVVAMAGTAAAAQLWAAGALAAAQPQAPPAG
jgi:hypothetical protein